MHDRCLLYYITDRMQWSGDENTRRRLLLAKITEAVQAGVDYIQLREKDLSAKELASLATEVMGVIRAESPAATTHTRLLINSRTDIALAMASDGVHLRAEDVAPSDVRRIVKNSAWSCSDAEHFLIAVSCHSINDVARAENEGADFAVFAPVFGKKTSPEIQPTGISALREACQASIPVFALGGVRLENALPCLDVGAAGVAGIRLFQENRVADIVRAIRRD